MISLNFVDDKQFNWHNSRKDEKLNLHASRKYQEAIYKFNLHFFSIFACVEARISTMSQTMTTVTLIFRENLKLNKHCPSLAKKLTDFWLWKERFPWATLLTELWRSFGSTFDLLLLLGQRNRRTTLFAVYWCVVRGYRWVTSLYDFLLPRAQVRRQPPVPKNCKISLSPVLASGEQKNWKSTSPTGTCEPGTKEPKTKSTAGRQ